MLETVKNLLLTFKKQCLTYIFFIIKKKYTLGISEINVNSVFFHLVLSFWNVVTPRVFLRYYICMCTSLFALLDVLIVIFETVDCFVSNVSLFFIFFINPFYVFCSVDMVISFVNIVFCPVCDVFVRRHV